MVSKQTYLQTHVIHAYRYYHAHSVCGFYFYGTASVPYVVLDIEDIRLVSVHVFETES